MLVTTFGCEKISAQKLKNIFFPKKLCSLKAHSHYFSVAIDLATCRAAKLIHFTFKLTPM